MPFLNANEADGDRRRSPRGLPLGINFKQPEGRQVRSRKSIQKEGKEGKCDQPRCVARSGTVGSSNFEAGLPISDRRTQLHPFCFRVRKVVLVSEQPNKQASLERLIN